MKYTRQIIVPVDERTAILYEKSDDSRKKSINFLIFELLREDKEKDALSLLMDKIGFTAISNGLTPDKLNEILKND